MNRRLSLVLSALVLSPIASFAQEADPYHATFGNYQLGDNISTMMDSSRTTITVSDNIWGEISKDPKAMCKQVGLGSNTSSRDITASRNKDWNRSKKSTWNNNSFNKGNIARASSKKGGGGISVFGLGSANGGGGGSSSYSKSWNKGNSKTGDRLATNTGKSSSNRGTKVTTSKVVVGTDCTALVESAASMENNRMNNDTQRLGILVGNETQRYGIDKQHQVAIKQIEAGQIQSVFGGGAKAMMGGMGQ